MSTYWLWWIVAVLAIGAELLSGTFYLLAVGVALAIGGVAAYFEASVPVQFATAGVLGATLVALAHRWRLAHAPTHPSVALDVGQTVTVDHWNPDGTLRVSHRGALWDAELASPDVARDATLWIVATRGSVLVLSDRRPA